MTPHVKALHDALDAADAELERASTWGRDLVEILSGGARLLVAGNGGSAAQAQHLTAELVGRYQGDRPAFSAIALHAETSSFTAIANDYGIEHVYARQVRAHGRPGDVCLLMSTSGRSPNIVEAARTAADEGIQVWAMTGRGPNPATEAAHDSITVPCDDTCTVQEVHLVALHMLCEAFDETLAARLPGTRTDGS